MTLRLAVTGATGRMAQEVLAAADERGHGTVPVSRAADRIDGFDTRSASDLAAVLSEERPDALVDFTDPASSVEYVAACAEAGVPAVVGTTGFSADQLAALQRASDEVPVLHAPNFSRGVAVLTDLVERATELLPEYDVELTETHHRDKRDAPSGTANALLDAIEGARTDAHATGERVHGREGLAPRDDGDVGVHARRAGDVRGEHEVLFAGGDESLSLTHRAGSRRVFAAGALDAAEWVAGRDAGRYDFAEVLE
ncbi:4-hydroxy-tetrahydrodipicolinate reductase [Halomarina oriensis]|uniref:4-hydroxy-tetrahydrodipicolinate reductase n=1 Tax=Halomarina oriensis TaxID=671145 RepID=A0A6B0GK22_9EURY|nr:4-hydroxy-tetrahydrodipicolinate reductase [Halomarina oriensis]MWG35202.1 4-hydroxy-tetrahydrodipicolinate reductase [Halomarina oriensis]